MATTAPYAKSIDQFRGKFAEMARPNLFQVSIYLPKTQLTPLQPVYDALVTSTQDNEGQGTTSLDELTQFMVKAASFPASTIGVVEVPFRGRLLKIAGDRTYDPWSVTVLNDEGFTIRQQMETWAQTIQEYKINGSSAQSTGEYMGRAIVDQLSRDGEVIKQATLEGIWPSNISALLSV